MASLLPDWRIRYKERNTRLFLVCSLVCRHIVSCYRRDINKVINEDTFKLHCIRLNVISLPSVTLRHSRILIEIKETAWNKFVLQSVVVEIIFTAGNWKS